MNGDKKAMMLTKESKDRIVKNSLELLSIKSETSDSCGILKCQTRLMAIAETYGFSATVHGKGKVIVIRPQENENDTKKVYENDKLGIVVHLDTVPFDEKNWKFNPLGELKDGFIFGRGIIDDKGPIAIALEVMSTLNKEIYPSWQIIVGSCEEAEQWNDMEFLKEESDDPNEAYKLPEFLVTIDGDGVKAGSKGYADVIFTFNGIFSKDRCYAIWEITDFYTPNNANNVIPSKATIKTSMGETINAYGITVHSSAPEMGRSAISSMACMIKESYLEYYCEFQKCFDFLAYIDDNPYSEKIFGKEGDIKSCISATRVLFNRIDRELKVICNLRLGPDVTKESFEKILKDISIMYNCSTQITGDLRFSSSIPEDSFEMTAMKEAYFEVIGKMPDTSLERGIGYNAALPNCAIFGPRFSDGDDPDPDYCHQPDERRSVSDIMKFAEILDKFVFKVLAKK